MAPKIKHYRVQAGETQAQVAKALGVAQPTFQRWETGKVEIPAEILAELSKRYRVTTQELEGRYAPRSVTFYDDNSPSELRHYGECAVHFIGGGEPLVLTISEAAFAEGFESLQEDGTFIIIRDLGNRTVAIRRKAISEFYFSAEACDTYGPDHDTYKLATPVHMPDHRDWQIVQALANEDEPDLSGFARENVDRVKSMIGISDEQFDGLVSQGTIAPEDLEAEKAKIAAITAEILALSHTVTVRLSSGRQRDFPHIHCNLYDCLQQLDLWDAMNEDEGGGMFVLPVEGDYHTAFFPAQAIDYISLPSHKVEADEQQD